jgi:hypothetical protein
MHFYTALDDGTGELLEFHSEASFQGYITAERYDQLMERLQEVCEAGTVFSRDEMNER